jgi:glycosyltransferase involved in cell wall biosynthesis
LVSVIIPTYNRSSYIICCLQTVYDQTYRPIEVLVVDDGSTDNTIHLVRKFKAVKETSDFVVKIIEQKNAGAPSARNNGIKNATGEYIQFLDSDDLLLPNKLESQVVVFNSEIDVVYSKAQFFKTSPQNLICKYWGREPMGNSSDFFEFPWQTMCALYSKKALDRFGYWNENYSLSDDWEFAMRYKILSNVIFLNEVSSLYRDHEGNRVGNNLDTPKIISLSKILLSIYDLSKQKDIIDNYLKKRYKSRFLYCLIMFGALGSFSEKEIFYDEIQLRSLGDYKLKLVRLINNIYLNRIIIKFYRLIK